MAELPRFNKGSFGELKWHHLNTAFDMIEGTEPNLARAQATKFPPVLLVRLGAEDQDGMFAWEEHHAGFPFQLYGFIQKAGGLNSGVYGQPGYSPARALEGSPEEGDHVLIVPRRDEAGGLWYAIIPGQTSTSRPMRIVGLLAHATRLDMWTYLVKPCRLIDDPAPGYNPIWVDLPGYPDPPNSIQAHNGAENPVDANGNIGVGSVVGGAQATRRPIKVNTVVVCTKTASLGSAAKWIFHCPNGYSLTCAP